jgi:hypothetical protein
LLPRFEGQSCWRKLGAQPDLKEQTFKTSATTMVAQNIVNSMATDHKASVPEFGDVAIMDEKDILRIGVAGIRRSVELVKIVLGA